MVLTPLQRDVVQAIAANRSETSYLAGGLVLNRAWPRQSDDIDIFQDTDEEVGTAADADIATLRQSRFDVAVDIEIYGLVEAIVSREDQSTLVQWMSESRTRFFPLVRDSEWGTRLHQCDLAVNKVIAASTRSKARDFVDLLFIAGEMCPLGPLILAAAGKPPHFSPLRTIEEIRRRAMSVADSDYASVRGLPKHLVPPAIRDEVSASLDEAEAYVRVAPVDLVGVLAVDPNGLPVTVGDLAQDNAILRRATREPEAMPSFPDSAESWKPRGAQEF